MTHSHPSSRSASGHSLKPLLPYTCFSCSSPCMLVTLGVIGFLCSVYVAAMSSHAPSTGVSPVPLSSSMDSVAWVLHVAAPETRTHMGGNEEQWLLQDIGRDLEYEAIEGADEEGENDDTPKTERVCTRGIVLLVSITVLVSFLLYVLSHQPPDLSKPGMQLVFTIKDSGDALTIPAINAGRFNAVIDWGDGTDPGSIRNYQSNNLYHHYAEPGDYTVSIDGTFPGLSFKDWYSKALIRIIRLGDTGLTTLSWAFAGCTCLTEVGGTANLSGVTDMSHMFSGCSGLTTVDVSAWDTSGVTDMSRLFYGCKGLVSLDLSTWDTSSVYTMSAMFQSCASIKDLKVSSFDTSSVTDLSDMFNGLARIKTLDLSRWDTSAVTNMSSLFYGCGTRTLMISTWDTSRVTDMSKMFYSILLDTLDISLWDTGNVANMNSMFDSCPFLLSLPIGDWDTSQVTSMSGMFQDVRALTSLDIYRWDTSSVTDMSGMFDSCYSLADFDVSSWDTSSVTDLSSMFAVCHSLTTLDLSLWDTSSVDNMQSVFDNCISLFTLDVATWDTSKVTSMVNLFHNCESLTSPLHDRVWDVSSLENSHDMCTGCPEGMCDSLCPY
ncbi:protein of unknown function DUF285 [Kipferlia bialata]|uniref:4Fe-4S ferredoxin-type domain-containing protein n=1 Tax=Kipferlia bialata TaxID=797122 RepID=A0A9K3GEW8_9EUKA|nr:protein of unknown function DUF285 [Kipferlia bialata]|eukprot:g1036.t1